MFTAIMAATPEGRVAKYHGFTTEAQADSHIAAFFGSYPDAFVSTRLDAPISHWLIDMAAKTAVISPPPPPDFNIIDAATVDRLLLESGVMRAVAHTLFDLVNGQRVLEGKVGITLAQFKTAFQARIR